MPPESTLQRKKLIASYPRVQVAITQAHIDTAIPADSGHCMIADALREALPHVRGVSVDLQTIRFTDPKKAQRYTYLTPPIAQDYLVAFDQGQFLEPFTFNLTSPIQVAHAGTKGKGSGLSQAYEGTKVTRSNKLVGVRLGGKPLPVAALHTGPGEYRAFTDPNRSQISEPLADSEQEPKLTSQPVIDVEPNATSQSVTNTEGNPTNGSGDTEPTSTSYPQVGNVTLSIKKGRVRTYGMRQLRAPSAPRGPSA